MKAIPVSFGAELHREHRYALLFPDRFPQSLLAAVQTIRNSNSAMAWAKIQRIPCTVPCLNSRFWA
jgi:hypothetical protein